MSTSRIQLERGGRLLADAQQLPGRTEVSLQLDEVNGPCVLHWGVGRGSRRWLVPPQAEWPDGSRAVHSAAVQTPFPGPDGSRLTIALGAPHGYTALDFVLFFPATGAWDNNRGRDYHVPLAEGHAVAAGEGAGAAERLESLARAIIEGETGNHGWTLMHRFNLCYDLLDRCEPGDAQALALVFVWLRFSAIRQLDWQRNYNTQPRELAHAQDRLTLKLAERYARNPGERSWLRLIMSTVGRGGEGQRVRDEVLNIMHRHHIKEVSGHFMEEWHQKLHNNTTPDDVVICEAYLAFLRSNGNRDVFYRTLESGGVTRPRLQGYERPIRSDPDFMAHLKGPLIADFEQFLHILKRLHSGTDLDAAVEDSRWVLDEHIAGLADWIRYHRDDPSVPVDVLVRRVTEVRQAIASRLGHLESAAPVRAFVYLDLALEERFRLSIERQLQAPLALGQMETLITLSLDNVGIMAADEELRVCERCWRRLADTPEHDGLRPLRMEAAIDRIGRRVAAMLDDWQIALQPKAEMLGRAFGADTWAVSSFSEEVIRGRAAVVLPVLARLVRRDLRRKARLPAWQLVSGGTASGELQLAETLEAVQATRFQRPTVIVAATVTGQEEMPPGVTAVLTPRDVDLLSHVAIRARNAGVLLATCGDADEFEHLKAFAGRDVTLTVGASGDLLVKPAVPGQSTEPTGAEQRGPVHAAPRAAVASSSRLDGPYVVTARDFNEATVGSKARNLARLEGKLPSWIHLPRSVAIPFGAFERALADQANGAPARQYRELLVELTRLPRDAARPRAELLGRLRDTVLALALPGDLLSALRSALEQTGIRWPDPEGAWSSIKAVWASKWNERAFLSREANHIDHDGVAMAVLIQPVIEAQYAFVIHTTNPSTAARDEIYAEMVVGLGETLVGNHPGRAFGFSWNKSAASARVRAFPSKSHGLFGGSLIFRSDSNAEDLADYAGAGLYDSVMLPPPRPVLLDYTDEPLVWDGGFGQRNMAKVAEIGIAVETALEVAQDIEGAYAGGEWHLLQARPQVGLRSA